MPRITLELLRKRSEHNEGIVSTLEEISLHQEELERIELIGSLCRRLRILYLQNNIIERMENLTHLKDLRYLNLALNNIKRIEGLECCEFLEKLDLTVNFVDFDTLEESINHLRPLEHLRELYMLGNPSQANWPGFQDYVIASLPQLAMLDGKEVHRSDRIKALQRFPHLRAELRRKAEAVCLEKRHQEEQEEKSRRAQQDEEEDDNQIQEFEVVNGKITDISAPSDAKPSPEQSQTLTNTQQKKKSVFESKESSPYTPESRREMYLELAEQKEEEEARKRENQPRERDFETEHLGAVEKTRLAEESGVIRQCNEGKWEFRMESEQLADSIVLEVWLPKHLDSSLIDVDVHPTFVSIVVKNKVLRLRFPEEVQSDAGKAERSRVTGALKLTLPKADPESVARCQRLKKFRVERSRDQAKTEQTSSHQQPATDSPADDPRVRKFAKPSKIGHDVLEATSKAVNIRALVDKSHQCVKSLAQMKAISTRTISHNICTTSNQHDEPEDEDAPPDLF